MPWYVMVRCISRSAYVISRSGRKQSTPATHNMAVFFIFVGGGGFSLHGIVYLAKKGAE